MKFSNFAQKPNSLYGKKWGYIFLAIGIPCFIFAVYYAYNSWSFMQKSVKTTGKVIELKEQYSRKNNTRRVSFAPLVEFRASDSKVYQYQHQIYARPPMYEIGDEVEVYYNSQNPNDASLGFSWFVTAILGFLGIIFTFFGLLFSKLMK